MPYYYHPAPASKRSDQAAPAAAPFATTMEHTVHNVTSQVDAPVDYRPQMVPFATKTDHKQPVRQLHPEQQQQRRQYQYPHAQMQAKSVHQLHSTAAPHVPSKQQNVAARSVVTTLLPYCTAEVTLSESQVIAVTDVAGSLKELVLLALGANDGDEESVSRLEGALGSEQAIAGVVDFFSDEFEVV